MTARGGNKVQKRKRLKTGFAKDRMGWAGRKGRHGGEAPALCVEADDVGLDSLVRSYQEERTNIKAAIDARRRTSPRWHDMAVGVNL